MKTTGKRPYVSRQRTEAAEATRARVLKSARSLFARRGIDVVTIDAIAARARVSPATVYAQFKSKEGLLQAMMEGTLFGGRFQDAQARLDAASDPVHRIAMSASIARAIYESESAELGLIRGASAFSPTLRKLEQHLEDTRLSMQRARLEHLFAEGKAKKGLSLEKARRLLWMYTGRDVYRLLVQEGGWTPDEYEAWLAETLVDALVEPSRRP